MTRAEVYAWLRKHRPDLRPDDWKRADVVSVLSWAIPDARREGPGGEVAFQKEFRPGVQVTVTTDDPEAHREYLEALGGWLDAVFRLDTEDQTMERYLSSVDACRRAWYAVFGREVDGESMTRSADGSEADVAG